MGGLLEKYGGVLVVHDIVSAFYDRMLDDDALADYFIDSDMEALVKHQTNFISSLMGGPGGVSDARLYEAHGHDLLDGGAGSDILTGGTGNDKFVISFDNLDNLDGPMSQRLRCLRSSTIFQKDRAE